MYSLLTFEVSVFEGAVPGFVSGVRPLVLDEVGALSSLEVAVAAVEGQLGPVSHDHVVA